ncbi:MAG: hypothetical protein MI892_27015 [Desulfobacterales bacterium]|nr:hypothetical protein [Desulfobacterales bacterium]
MADTTMHNLVQANGYEMTSRMMPNSNAPQKITVELTPGENNVDSGDRSENTVQLDVTTLNKAFSVEISREGLVARRHQKNTEKAMEKLSGKTNHPPAVSAYLAISSGNADSQNIEDAAMINLSKNKAQAYAMGAGNDSNAGDLDTEDETAMMLVHEYNQAAANYRKQQFIFSAPDRREPLSLKS